MADRKISELPVISAVTGTDEFIVASAGLSKKATTDQLKTFINPNIGTLPAAGSAVGAQEIPVNDAGTSRKVTVTQLSTFVTSSIVDTSITRVAGTMMVAGPFMSWLVLAANSADITGTVLTVVMSITGVDVGRYYFKCQLIYQTTALTTGIDAAANHTGTTTQWVCEHRFSSIGPTGGGGAGTAATTFASESAAHTSGNLYESQGNRTKNAIIGVGTASVDIINADMISTIEGFFVVSVTGNLEIKLAAESAALVCRAMQGSFLELKKLS